MNIKNETGQKQEEELTGEKKLPPEEEEKEDKSIAKEWMTSLESIMEEIRKECKKKVELAGLDEFSTRPLPLQGEQLNYTLEVLKVLKEPKYFKHIGPRGEYLIATFERIIKVNRL